MQPLDLLKVRLQVSQSNSQSTNIWRSLFITDGLSGMFGGVTTNIIGNSISWGGYFWL